MSKNYEKELLNFIKNHKNEVLKKLEFLNLSEEDLLDNFFFFYRSNSEKLIKINDIITNIQLANFDNLSPQEILEKIVPES